MAALALPSAPPSATNSPSKGEKRKRPSKPKEKKSKDKNADKGKEKEKEKDAEGDSDAELEVSAEDLVAAADDDAEGAEGGRRRGGDGDGDEDDDEEGGATVVAVDVARESKRRRDETLLLRGVLDEEQGKRFDAFRSTVVPKAVVKKLNRDIFDQHIPNNLTAVVASLAKVFVADVVETAKQLQPYTDHPDGPLQPYHFQMARIRLAEQGLLQPPGGGGSIHSTTGLRPRKRLFRR